MGHLKDFFPTRKHKSSDIELLITPEEISQKLADVARLLEVEYHNKNLTILMVMKGSICITADLIRHLRIPTQIEYIKAMSYGQGGTQRGDLKILGIENLNLEGRHVLLVDDICDSGHTLSKVVDSLKDKKAKSIKSLVLLLKNIGREPCFLPDYSLFQIEDRFVIGYGLDYKEYYRGLPGIYAFVNDRPPEHVDEVDMAELGVT